MNLLGLIALGLTIWAVVGFAAGYFVGALIHTGMGDEQ